MLVPLFVFERALGDAPNTLDLPVVIAGVLVYFTLTFFLMQFATGVTHLQVQALLRGDALTLGQAFAQTVPNSGRFVLSSLILTPALAVSIPLLIAPLYVFTVYGFVPHFMLTYSGLPLMAYFYRSSRLARRRLLWLLGGNALGFFLIAIAEFAAWILGDKYQPLGLVLSCLVAYLVTIVSHIWLACNFNLLKGDSP